MIWVGIFFTQKLILFDDLTISSETPTEHNFSVKSRKNIAIVCRLSHVENDYLINLKGSNLVHVFAF